MFRLHNTYVLTGNREAGYILYSFGKKDNIFVCLHQYPSDHCILPQKLLGLSFIRYSINNIHINAFTYFAGIYEKALAAIIDMVKSLKLGDPTDPSTSMGPLINVKGLEKVFLSDLSTLSAVHLGSVTSSAYSLAFNMYRMFSSHLVHSHRFTFT